MPGLSKLLSATTSSLIWLALLASPVVHAQSDTDPWTATGSASFYWHNRYHGCLAMSAYGDYNNNCPKQFTSAALQQQYPGNTNNPFEVVGTWGPTAKYKQEGYMVRVPEMNKILMVFKGDYGWQNYNATLVPFLGIGCDSSCTVHKGALEAWHEIKAATNDMQNIKNTQQDLVWSSTGHGFGGMVAQVAALDLKTRGFAYSAHSFGAPPVFNQDTANLYNNLFPADASQRTVSNQDSIPAAIPFNGKQVSNGTYSPSQYVFVNTGIHVYGSGNPMYGQHYDVCEGWNQDPRCAGGNVEADHYFYFTQIGDCCGQGYQAATNPSLESQALYSDQAAYRRTAAGPLGTPITGAAYTPAPTTFTTVSVNKTSTMAAANATSTSVHANTTTTITTAHNITSTIYRSTTISSSATSGTASLAGALNNDVSSQVTPSATAATAAPPSMTASSSSSRSIAFGLSSGVLVFVAGAACLL